MIDTARIDLLRPAERKRAIHGALVGALAWFRGERLRLRFQEWARSNLGYRGPELYSPRALMAAFAASGGRARMINGLLRGWDPWRNDPVPQALLRWWVEVHEGRSFAQLRSATGRFSTMKKGLRAWAKDYVRRGARNAFTDGALGDKHPFVFRGELRDAAAAARIVARTPRGGVAQASIKIDAHALRPEYAQVFRRITAEELAEMQRRVVDSVQRSLAGMVASADGGQRLAPERHTHLQDLLRAARDRRVPA